MIRAVLLAVGDLENELRGTLLFRSNVQRIRARGAEDVRRAYEQGRADIVILDAALPGAASIAAALRGDPMTRTLSIVALDRSGFGFANVDLLEAGVNAVLPLPPGADWDDRLVRLVHVPVRKVTRFPVDFALQGGRRGGETFIGRALNLSVHGLLLESAYPLAVGEDLRLTFDLPDEPQPVQGTGTVVREDSPRQFGVELTSVQGDGRVRIKRFVEGSAP